MEQTSAQQSARWLSQDEQRTWRSFLAATGLLNQALDRQLQRDAGMPHTYYMILAMLSEAPDRALRMTELADATNSSQSRLSHAIARLEEAGSVIRQKCPSDKRGNIATLTDAGFAALAAAAPGHVTAVRHGLFERLTPDQVRQLGEICTAVLTGLTQDGVVPGTHP